MTAISKNVCINKLDDIVKYNDTYHRKVKMKPVDVKTNTYNFLDVKSNDPKFKVGNEERI